MSECLFIYTEVDSISLYITDRFLNILRIFFWLHWNWKHSLRSDNSLKVWLKKFHIFYSQPWVALTADILRMQPKRFPNQLLQTHCWHCLVNCILRRPCSVFPQAVVSEFITGIHSCGLAGTNAEQRRPANTVCAAVFFPPKKYIPEVGEKVKSFWRSGITHAQTSKRRS